MYDANYLSTLVRYIEFNPVNANITKNIGEHKWAMSACHFQFSMLNFKLIEKINFDEEPDETELKKMDKLYHFKVEIQER